MNMSLNQRGLFQEVIRDPQDRTKKLCAGSLTLWVPLSDRF